jgi:hypothetical protein
MISHKYRCIFVHIPKCGGSSIEDVIWPDLRTESDFWMGFISNYRNKYQTGGLQHLFANHILNEIGIDLFQNYFKFSIVRNPWDKAISQYTYMAQRPDLREFIGLNEQASFKTYLDLIRKKTHVQWEQQYKFVLDQNGNLMIDYLGRFENINQDAKAIFKRLNIQAELPHKNSTVHHHYLDYYDQETIEMVADLYAEDIRQFRYSFSSERAD